MIVGNGSGLNKTTQAKKKHPQSSPQNGIACIESEFSRSLFTRVAPAFGRHISCAEPFALYDVFFHPIPPLHRPFWYAFAQRAPTACNPLAPRRRSRGSPRWREGRGPCFPGKRANRTNRANKWKNPNVENRSIWLVDWMRWGRDSRWEVCVCVCGCNNTYWNALHRRIPQQQQQQQQQHVYDWAMGRMIGRVIFFCILHRCVLLYFSARIFLAVLFFHPGGGGCWVMFYDCCFISTSRLGFKRAEEPRL